MLCFMETKILLFSKQLFSKSSFLFFFQQNACNHVHGRSEYMSSPQCLDPRSDATVTMEMCYPSTEEIIKQVFCIFSIILEFSANFSDAKK